MVQLTKEDYRLIVAHAEHGLPNECCGLFAGTAADGVSTVRKVYPLANADNSREHFSIDPSEHLAAVRDMRANGLTPLGNFHSHPETPARMSDEDRRLARDKKALYMIVSLADARCPVVKIFRAGGDGFIEEQLTLT